MSHVPSCKIVRLDVSNKLAMCEAMLGVKEETKYGAWGKTLVNNVVIGDNVVPCESGNGEQFWLLFYDIPIHIVVETFTYAYINKDFIICGHYYNLIWPRNRSYHFNDEVKLAYIYSHLMCASKFAMPPTSHNVHGSYPTFELQNETLQLIEEALEDLHVLHGDL
jgi:hypothetical protein